MKIEQRHGWTYVRNDFAKNTPVAAIVPHRDTVIVFFKDSHLVLRRKRSLVDRLLRR